MRYRIVGSPGPGRERHIAFAAPSRDEVRAFHAPRYAAFIRDPDGHNIEAVCRRPGG
jgi:catechol 2,3-dioxygenase-like lactoylglutathione lyase family enzyme